MLIGMMFGWCTTASGQRDTVRLDNVDVISTRVHTDIIPVQTLSGENLERLNALNVADALRHFSGLQVKDYGGVGGIKTVNIRSMGSQHMGIYYDGIELGNAQNGQIDLGQLSMDNIGEVSVYNGQRSSLMQTASDYGNAGTVYLRTRIPVFTDGKKYNFRAKAKYGISNMLNLSALYERQFSDKVSASFALGTLTSDGKYDFRYKRLNYDGTVAYDTTAVRQNGDVQAIRFEANIYGTLPETGGGHGGYWRVKGYTYQSNRGIPGAIVNNVWHREERQVDGNTFFQAIAQKEFSNRYVARALVKYANYYTHYENHDTTTMIVDNKYRQQEYFFSTTHCYEIMKGWNASIAYDLRHQTLTSDAYNCPQPRRWTHMVSLATAVSLRRFSMQASLLYNNTRDRGEASEGGNSVVGNQMKVSRFTPAVFFNYVVHQSSYVHRTSSISLRGFYKNSFRMPTFNDLYYTQVGNSNLSPEKAQQWDLGTMYKVEGLRLRVEGTIDGYYNRVTDKIVAYPKGQQFRWTMLNLGKVDIWGMDVNVNVNVNVNHDWKAGLRLQYTLQSAVDHSNPEDSYYGHQIPYIPHHSGSVTGMLDYKSLSLTYTFIYTGARYSQQENIQRNYLQPWYTSDLALSYRFNWNKTQLRATLECNNVFSQDYDVILNYPMPKRNFAIGLDVEL